MSKKQNKLQDGGARRQKRGRFSRIDLLYVLAAVLLLGSLVGSARAALTYYSETYLAHMEVESIGVTLVENGKDISWRDYTHADDKWDEHTGALVETMLTDAGDETLVLNKTYKEELTVRNSGTIDEYVRVNVYCYWEDGDGSKRTDLDPAWIDLHLTGNGWLEDETAATAERRVLYYDKILDSGDTAPLFADTLTIGEGLKAKVTETTVKEENGVKTITTTYDYGGVRFVLEAEVDAVQTHNAKDAIMSAWGIDVTIGADGTLQLNESSAKR